MYYSLVSYFKDSGGCSSVIAHPAFDSFSEFSDCLAQDSSSDSFVMARVEVTRFKPIDYGF